MLEANEKMPLPRDTARFMMITMQSKTPVTSSRLMQRIEAFVRWYLTFLHSPSPLRRGIGLGVFSGAAFLAVLGLMRIIDPYPLKDWIYLRLSLQDLGVIGPLIFVVLISVLPLISPLSLLIVTGSASFGPVPGMILSYVGSLINANIAFLLVKALGVEDRWGNEARTARIKLTIQKNGYPIVLLLQLATIFPFIVINSAAAAAGVEWKDFMKATFVGILPSMALYSFLGEAIVSDLLSPQVYFALIIVVFLTIVLTALRKKNIRLRRKRVY
jgi:uncharacterized membrane protein YdjX (TVP38/TMEM64 family)